MAKRFYIVGREQRGQTKILCWDTKVAKEAGVFNLNKMSWKPGDKAKHPIFFSDPALARIFSNRISGPAKRYFLYTGTGRIDPDALNATRPNPKRRKRPRKNPRSINDSMVVEITVYELDSRGNKSHMLDGFINESDLEDSKKVFRFLKNQMLVKATTKPSSLKITSDHRGVMVKSAKTGKPMYFIEVD